MKLLKIILIVLLVAAFGVLGFFVYKFNNTIKEQAQAIAEKDDTIGYLQTAISDIQSQLDTALETQEVYVTTDETEIAAGHKLKRLDLQKVKIPNTKSLQGLFITDENIDDYIGKIFKFKVAKNIPITTSMFRDSNQYEQEIFYCDLVPDILPLGLRAGDKIQVRLQLISGESFVVISNKEVLKITDKVVQVALSEAEYLLIQSMNADIEEYTVKAPGIVKMTLLRYFEDNDDQVSFYPVREDMVTLVNLSPNIDDTTRLVIPDIRNYLDYSLLKTTSQYNQQKYTQGGFSKDAAINSAYTVDLEQEEGIKQESEEPQKETKSSSSGSTGIFSID